MKAAGRSSSSSAFADAPEVLPTSGDTDVKEQLKLLPKDNMKPGLSEEEK